MALAPIFNSPCDLGQRMPAMVSAFLDLESMVGRRFREDSVSDIIVASLLMVSGSWGFVMTPPEAKTGSDFDLLIVDVAASEAIQYRLQAKRLFPHDSNWLLGTYRELLSTRYCKTGVDASEVVGIRENTYVSLYAFYNPQAVCDSSQGIIWGLNWRAGKWLVLLYARW